MRTYTAFDGHRRVAAGGLLEVALAVRAWIEGGGEVPLIFADATGRVVDLSQHGTEEDVRERVRVLEAQDASVPAAPKRGRGRPKLGVVSKEVTLLPRHWAWLGLQRGGASATLRRLVDRARKESAPAERARRSQDAAYRFLSAVAGDLPGFEEALRALYRGDAERFGEASAEWPGDVREYGESLAAGALGETDADG